MKKVFTSLIAVLFCLAIAAAPTYAGSHFNVDSHATGHGFDIDSQYIPNGSAFGLSGAVGSADSHAAGGIYHGEAEGNVNSGAGGITNTQAYAFNPGIGDVSIGVGSYSESVAVTGASTDIRVEGFRGRADSDIEGFAAQGTLNSSNHNFSNGNYTEGIAAQGSLGGFNGQAKVVTLWGEADAEMEARINMEGSSYSGSYRFMDSDSGSVTKGMGTNVGANIDITSYGDSHVNRNGWAGGSAHVNGGFMAVGGATTETVQKSSTGKAVASATGGYVGLGNLNTNYTGSVQGYSGTQITTFNGMNGSIVHSSAGMSVSSRTY